MALDGDKRPCLVRASNAGHLLYAGLAAPDRAALVAEKFLSAPFNSGWGVRTLAHGEARFNPMSYHNGSVWPHDTGLCIAGMARYGHRKSVVRLLSLMYSQCCRWRLCMVACCSLMMRLKLRAWW